MGARDEHRDWGRPNPLDDVEFTRGVRDTLPTLDGCPTMVQRVVPADICPIGSENIPEGRFGSYEVLFGLNVAGTRPVRRDGVSVIEPKFTSQVERGALNIKPLPPIKAPTWNWDTEFKQHIAEQQRLFGGTDAASQKG